MYNGEVYGYFSNSVFAVFYRIISSFCSCFQRFLACPFAAQYALFEEQATEHKCFTGSQTRHAARYAFNL